jgi:hypothetical protein
MKTKLLSIAIGLVLATTSYSSSLFHHFYPNKSKQNSISSLKSVNPDIEYTDFSGEWIGSCDDNPDWENELKSVLPVKPV